MLAPIEKIGKNSSFHKNDDASFSQLASMEALHHLTLRNFIAWIIVIFNSESRI